MSLRPGPRSIFFDPQGPLADYYSKTPIIGWYFVTIKSPKKTFLSSISGMFSKPEPYYLFEKDTSHTGYKEAGSQRAEFPVSKIILDEIIPDEEDQSKIQTGGKRSHRKSRSKKSKKSKKSRKVRHH